MTSPAPDSPTTGDSPPKTPGPHQRHGSATVALPGAFISAGGYVILEKYRWRTPPDVFKVLNDEFDFDLDAATEDACALCPRWFTAAEDCLTANWHFGWRYHDDQGVVRNYEPGILRVNSAGLITKGVKIRTAFINPPYGSKGLPKKVREAFPDQPLEAFPGTAAFVRRGWEMSRKGITVVCLIAQALDTEWLRKLIMLADEVRIGPRIRFIDVKGQVGTQPSGGHMLVIFRPNVPDDGWENGPRRVVWDWDPYGGKNDGKK